ncbi:hypothetical protein AK88_00882 [Plasmodium fragile]|uniref:Telomere length regulation protein conserved domain-containing protein n=1 Tax=Plasmodium fragile TaxID=5857 RepID=A0A0D9QQU6_PLAFR|nr:uncharacterized protein AK88_00882 [Plasmodium fragile]KJP89439.1 hypothetical protein AK88_00882 [Plasmodium fragile]
MMNPKEETHLEDVLPKGARGGDVEKVLKKFFATHIPLSVQMAKMQMRGNNEGALKMMKNNMNKLIGECFFILHSIISSALKGVLKIETIEEARRYHLIYLWFIPVCEVGRRKELHEEVGKDLCRATPYYNSDFVPNWKDSGGRVITQVERLFPFGGVYLSEWIISGVNKALSMVLGGSADGEGADQVDLENWSFVLDLIKFVYVEGDILSKYLRGGVLHQEDTAGPPQSTTHMEQHNSNVKAIKQRENNIDTALEKYHEDIHNIIKAYFTLPFVLFKCITDVGVKKGSDEKRKLYIYQHIIPGALNDEGFSKHVVNTCVFYWLHGDEATVNYEKMALLTKRVVNSHLVNPFCQTLLEGLLLVRGSGKVEQLEHVADMVKADDLGESSEDVLKLTRMNQIVQNLFYYVHLYCHGESAGEKLLTSLIENMSPFVKVVQNEEKLSLCLFNRSVKHLLCIIIKLSFLYKWDFYILEKFFSINCRNFLPLSFSLTFIELISDLVGPNWTSSNALFANFTREKEVIHSSEVIRERTSYRTVVRQVKGEEIQSIYSCDTHCTLDERSTVGIMAFEFLQEMFFFVLGQFSPDSQQKGSSSFVPIMLSKLLYTFSMHMKFVNKKLVDSSYQFDVLSEVDLHIYKLNSQHSAKVFERVTIMVRELFNRKDEVSLVAGQILADHFRIYVDGLSYKGEEKYKRTEIEMGSCEDCEEGGTLFPNLKQPAESFPAELRCFKVIKQSGFVYLEDLIRTSDPEWGMDRDKWGDELDDEMDDEMEDETDGEMDDQVDVLVASLREPPLDQGKKRSEDDMLIQNADSLIDNELYDIEEKQFLVELELENEFYLNLDRNKHMYTDPPEDLFECLHRMKNKANYIERNEQDMNNDHLKLNEQKETYDEENFRICQAVVSLPRFIRKGDVLTYLCVELYEALLSLNHSSCLLREGKSPFATIKLLDMILLTINAPIEICNFVFKNVYSNMYSSVQKMVMLLCLQLCVLFLAGRATLRQVFQSASEITAQMELSVSGKNVRREGSEEANRCVDHQADLGSISDKFYHLIENFPSGDGKDANYDHGAVHVASERVSLLPPSDSTSKRESDDAQVGGRSVFVTNGANGEHGDEEQALRSGNTGWKRNTDLLLKPNRDTHERSKICLIREKDSNNALLKKKEASKMSLQNSGEKKTKSMTTLCSFFFASAYTKLLNVNRKKEAVGIEYDEHKLRKYYSNDASIVLSLISTYMVFFTTSCNCTFYIEDILLDGFTLTNYYIRNKNFLIRRVSFKLLFHMINFILKKKKFYLLEHANYMEVINYMSENVCFDQDGPSVHLMQYILGVHEAVVGGVLQGSKNGHT